MERERGGWWFGGGRWGRWGPARGVVGRRRDEGFGALVDGRRGGDNTDLDREGESVGSTIGGRDFWDGRGTGEHLGLWGRGGAAGGLEGEGGGGGARGVVGRRCLAAQRRADVLQLPRLPGRAVEKVQLVEVAGPQLFSNDSTTRDFLPQIEESLENVVRLAPCVSAAPPSRPTKLWQETTVADWRSVRGSWDRHRAGRSGTPLDTSTSCKIPCLSLRKGGGGVGDPALAAFTICEQQGAASTLRWGMPSKATMACEQRSEVLRDR
ncbi:hypothetical protein BDK51DRAFT_37167 [Blyttiomyces helicus]|uniref:Uncharacterized protein n=1 Tax=Blyttiomyces helicus TaxID=388810 RepID=A0A4P9WCH1_9FUNG|nr:hypothetical protein BDK51DRAFT_37167 [Blyttiomyces helicus]|eukprot:RKO89345.1 hypothetical protein BDK51DRAFT_37167 [Blyttiomyces helicus]